MAIASGVWGMGTSVRRVLRRRASVFHVAAWHFSKAFLLNGDRNFLRRLKPLRVFQPKPRVPAWQNGAEKFPTFCQSLLNRGAILCGVAEDVLANDSTAGFPPIDRFNHGVAVFYQEYGIRAQRFVANLNWYFHRSHILMPIRVICDFRHRRVAMRRILPRTVPAQPRFTACQSVRGKLFCSAVDFIRVVVAHT